MCIHICVCMSICIYIFSVSLALPIICTQSGYEVKITIRTKAHT